MQGIHKEFPAANAPWRRRHWVFPEKGRTFALIQLVPRLWPSPTNEGVGEGELVHALLTNAFCESLGRGRQGHTFRGFLQCSLLRELNKETTHNCHKSRDMRIMPFEVTLDFFLLGVHSYKEVVGIRGCFHTHIPSHTHIIAVEKKDPPKRTIHALRLY